MSWLSTPIRYCAIDGGSGAHLLAALAERDPRMRATASPRHANVLLVVAPIGQKLIPALTEMARALPRPAHVLVVTPDELELDQVAATLFAPIDALFPDVPHTTSSTLKQGSRALSAARQAPEMFLPTQPAWEADTIQLPPKQDQEIATELIVFSLGPIQPFTAGPLRLLLTCDGEQILSAQVETGYAHWGIDQAMLHTDWQHNLQLARFLDPLAPLASQLAYVQALEQLQGWSAPPFMTKLREAALAIERAQNALWWFVRFTELIAAPRLISVAHRIATTLSERSTSFWRLPPQEWVMPQRDVLHVIDERKVTDLHALAKEIETFSQQVERDRGLALRTRRIGHLSAEQLTGAGVSGPVLLASDLGEGDVQSRIHIRLLSAARDLHQAASLIQAKERNGEHPTDWTIPAGEAHVSVEGPRGLIGLHLVSEGGTTPHSITWQRPSTRLLTLLPELLAGQKLVDAETIVASLDLSMMEADG